MSDDILKLDEICVQLFGIKPDQARRKAVLGQLPIAAFRLGNTRKGPFFVNKADLDKLIADRHAKAKKFTAGVTTV